MAFQLTPILIPPGIDKDNTVSSAVSWTAGDKVRFIDTLPEKIGGFDTITFDDNLTILGCILGLFAITIGNNQWRLPATEQKLYSFIGTELTNITPFLVTSDTLGSNPVATFFPTLANDPIATVNLSTTLTVTETAHDRVAGDSVTLAGSSAVNGVPAGEINISQLIRAVTTNTFDIIVSTAATSTSSGGGASITVASPLIRFTDTAHLQANGDRVKILGSTGTIGNIPSSEINAEHIIRNVQTNSYDTIVTTDSTSAATGGGASVTRQKEIVDGNCDASFGRGYGMGRFGVGKYGVSKTSVNLLTIPRLWSFARFGQLAILTPGDNSTVYNWAGDTDDAPIVTTNAPTGDLVFTDRNIINVLNAGGVDGRIQWNDPGELTDWTATPFNFAGQDDIEEADAWLSQINVRGTNLLWTNTQTFTHRFIGRPFVWETKLLDSEVGIISQNARAKHRGKSYWMANDNFYSYSGGVIEPIRGNGRGGRNPVRDFVFDNLNTTQKSKCFAWSNAKFDEIWFHYPSGSSTFCDKVVAYNTVENHWVTHTFDRSSAEFPIKIGDFPHLGDEDGCVLRHEKGTDADASALAFSVTNNSPISVTNKTVDHSGIYPDSNQVGDITVSFAMRQFPQGPLSTAAGSPFTVTPTTTQLAFTLNGNNYRVMTIAGSAVGQSWRMGQWLENIDLGTTV